MYSLETETRPSPPQLMELRRTALDVADEVGFIKPSRERRNSLVFSYRWLIDAAAEDLNIQTMHKIVGSVSRQGKGRNMQFGMKIIERMWDEEYSADDVDPADFLDLKRMKNPDSFVGCVTETNIYTFNWGHQDVQNALRATDSTLTMRNIVPQPKDIGYVKEINAPILGETGRGISESEFTVQTMEKDQCLQLLGKILGYAHQSREKFEIPSA